VTTAGNLVDEQEPGDTEHIMNEIDALAQFRGQPNIAQLVGLVVSENNLDSPSNWQRIVPYFILVDASLK
jgi:hypothetical protein